MTGSSGSARADSADATTDPGAPKGLGPVAIGEWIQGTTDFKVDLFPSAHATPSRSLRVSYDEWQALRNLRQVTFGLRQVSRPVDEHLGADATSAKAARSNPEDAW